MERISKKGDIGDVGVDLVAEERYFPGEYCGIQCKFYLPENTVSKKEIDSFYTAVGNPLFTSGIIVSTTDKWGPNAEHARSQIHFEPAKARHHRQPGNHENCEFIASTK